VIYITYIWHIWLFSGQRLSIDYFECNQEHRKWSENRDLEFELGGIEKGVFLIAHMAYMKLCYLNILWTPDPGVLNKLSHQTRALGNALGRDGAADCLVVVRQEVAETVQKNPSLTLFPISAPGSSSVQEALLPFLVWSKLKNRLSGYDAVVTRWTVPSPTFLNVVRRQTVFTEHHSKELEEISSRS
jgi:hypothetical protein